IDEACNLPVREARTFLAELELDEREGKIAGKVLAELQRRLRFFADVGLDYLTLDRPFGTLSGGEAQRIALATSLGTGLVGTLYVLDEPSIGLHPRDTDRLVEVLKALRDQGNTVVVVEHDKGILKVADHIIPLGTLTCVTGVSGSGKSTLVHDVICAGLLRRRGRWDQPVGEHDTIDGASHVEEVVLVDQSPIGRTPRSNPATYLKAFDGIRE